MTYTVTPWAELFWSKLLEGYCSCPKRLNEHALPFSRYPKNRLGSIPYIWHAEGYCITLPKPTRILIPSLGYLIIKHHKFTLLEGVLFIFKTKQYTYNNPRLSKKYILSRLCNTLLRLFKYVMDPKGVLIYLYRGITFALSNYGQK